MKNLYSIGEVSKIKDITIKALRYYYKMGILIPKHIEKESGYRYYSIEQFIYIDIIKICRDLDTSIAELQVIFKECSTDKLLEFLQIKRSEAEEKITKMQDIIKNIDILNQGVKTSRELLNEEEITIKFLEERYILTEPCKEVGKLKELLYYSELDKSIQQENIDITLERGIIYNLDENGEVKPQYVYNTVIKKENMDENNKIKILPKGRYLTLTYNQNNLQQRREQIIRYVIENNLKIKPIIEVDLFNEIFSTENYSYQLQILINDSDEKNYIG